MTAKLKVDLSAGILEVEGEEDFVREIHDSFRSYATQQARQPKREPMSQAREAPQTAEDDNEGGAQSTQRRKRSGSRRPRTPVVDGTVRPSVYAPSVIRDLDLRGLKEFVAPYTLNGHSDKILAFGMFLRDEKDIHPFTADHVYTAYRFVGERTPGAFLQAIRDASKKKDLIDYQSPTHISVTHIGENRFLHDLPKGGAEA